MRKLLAFGFCLLGAVPAMAAGVDGRLVDAVRDSDARTVKNLLANHANANATLPDKSTVLAWAIDRQNEEIVRLLLAAGAKPNARDFEGYSPITQACELGDPAIVSSLLKAGADAKTLRPDGVSAFELCAGTVTPELLAAMAAKGAKVDAADPKGQTPLMWAAAKGQAANIAFLLKHGAAVNAVSKKGFTPLFFAIQSKAPDASLALLNAGADTKAQLADGTSVIQAAILENNIPFAMDVVSRGADLTAHDKQGRQLIHVAAASGSADLVKLVVSKGADVNVLSTPPPAPPAPAFGRQAPPPANQAAAGGTPGGAPAGGVPGKPRLARADGSSGPPPPPPIAMPPLLYAAKAGSAEAMKALIDAGAKPDLKAKDGTTVALAAASGGNLAAMQYALQIDPNINAKASGGRGILHIAAANAGAPDGEAVITYLVDHGAKLDAKDDRGRTPADSVPEDKHDFFNALLKQHGIALDQLGPADASEDSAVDLVAELTTASTHAGLAAKATTIDMMHMHMHHAINCLVGPSGAGFDATNANPCAKSGTGAIPDSTDAGQKKKLQAVTDQLKAGLAVNDLAAAGKVATAASADIAAAKGTASTEIAGAK